MVKGLTRRAPAFWQAGATSFWPAMLAPAGWAYGAVTMGRFFLAAPARLPVPVICVGGLVAGGSGKTPLVQALARRLLARGHRPCVVLRGYGGRLPGPARVIAGHHSAADVGDEALLHAAICPAIIARDRTAGAWAALAGGADVILLDDGFHSPALARDLSLLVTDSEYGLGNGRMIPAGPLRAPVFWHLRRARALIVMGDGQAARPLAARAVKAGLPVLHARLVPFPAAPELADRDVIAFAGIGHPEKFFRALEKTGARIRATRAFADHHPYDEDDARSLLQLAGQYPGAIPVTTEKDMVRLDDARRGPRRQLRKKAIALPVRLELAESEGLDRLLDQLVFNSRSRPRPTSHET
ncbi:MAG TPA: tetraacyldisaccharide 4'-kinase [Rhodobacteraceae bacterium]|nr:tetraacyldisaccharide 4'-kinase [Paracoccaceae bacterium]